MKDEDINRLIAEACNLLPTVGEACKPIPDYCRDLNAIREATLTLSAKEFVGKDAFIWSERCEFMAQLERIVVRDAANDRCNFDCYNATARQRAEAFLRAKGRWPGGQQI